MTKKNIRHGEAVVLVKQGLYAHKLRGQKDKKIPIGTKGITIALRDQEGKRQYLVKFQGVGSNRHCEEDEIERINELR